MEEHRRRLAEILSVDQARRAVAEAEIARKEAILLAEMARLARMKADADALEAELEQARREAAEDGPAEA